MMKISPSDSSYKTFCDLVTGYRLLHVIIQAVQSGVIDLVGTQHCTVDQLVETTSMKREEGHRFISLLISSGILERYGDHIYLSAFARKYLHRDSISSQRNVLDFELLLAGKWGSLGTLLSSGQGALVVEQPPSEYAEMLRLFQDAMHEAAIVRSAELWNAVPELPETGRIIDVGAGDGTYLREFLKNYPGWQTIACDLPDALEVAAHRFDGTAIQTYPCNIIDQTERDALIASHRHSASVVLLSNFIHCYGERENRALVQSLANLLKDDGMLIIHDFFTDGNSFSALYDLHMMINTLDGRTYSFEETKNILCEAGFNGCRTIELNSHSHAVLATRHAGENREDPLSLLRREAVSLGFFEAASVNPAVIRIEPWVQAKCAYGCMFYGRKWSCPPHALDSGKFRELLGCYSKAMVVAGQPPLRDFQDKLLGLEKTAFLNGYQKALVFSGGPCTWCENCNDSHCLFPEKRRPSLEACGCDVFALTKECGIGIAPVRGKDDFVHYIGMLLIE